MSYQTFSVLPIIRKAKMNSNGEVPIYIRITVNGEVKELSTIPEKEEINGRCSRPLNIRTNESGSLCPGGYLL